MYFLDMINSGKVVKAKKQKSKLKKNKQVKQNKHDALLKAIELKENVWHDDDYDCGKDW